MEKRSSFPEGGREGHTSPDLSQSIHPHSPNSFSKAIIPQPTERASKRPTISMLCFMAALYWSSKGTSALVAQKFSMYRAVPKRNATARITGQIDRQGASKTLSPEDTKSE